MAPKELFPGDALHYAREKLGEAIHELATGTGRVQERLFQAALYLHRIDGEALPDEEMRRMLAGIMDDLSLHPRHASQHERRGCRSYCWPHPQLVFAA